METCFECKKPTETVIDKCTGDTICTECSLVISHHYIDDSQEWRTFVNDDNSDRDPNRVGGPTNLLLKSGGIGTSIDKGRGNTSSVSKNNLYELFRAQNHVKNSEDELIEKACKEIKRISEDLGLISGVEFRACEIVSKLDGGDSSKRLRREKHMNALCAAAVSTACRELKLSRTLKEISVVAGGVDLKDINKASRTIRRLVGSDQDEVDTSTAASQVIIKTGELVSRFCSKLDISVRETKAIREAVENADNFDIRRNPKSILAAVILMVCQLSQTKGRSIREIAVAAEVAENTIKNAVNDIYPYASKIIPPWYASEEDIIERFGGTIGSWDAEKHTA
ncbi:Cyclin-like family protein [Raphanus sativus]|uniref:Plant-specific TFIIB-related protein 2-like n=1 Tax=Raphanus sativus TaxID=3726 RepID=A0A6J0LE55_RAPSA|nr:plant-specific TFIIB-related protein 2-like [Raphanus sativus]KAJ4900880.1 Cyclin-like family protein [Raphanus sativus]